MNIQFSNTYKKVATHLSKLALALEMIESAESSIRSAKLIISELTGDGTLKKKQKLTQNLDELHAPVAQGRDTIIEGIFDGEKMIGSDKKEYVVPANYASKSKLVQGDVLKLTIKDDGSFLYKIIGPVERKHIMGTLTYDEGKYRVLAGGKVYNVLLASVTYFKGEVGDKVSLLVPEQDDAEWGAVEAIIPANSPEFDHDMDGVS